MRRETCTLVALVGAVGEGLLATLASSQNISVVRAADDGREIPLERGAWEPGAAAMRAAARRRSTYVLVADDPLADVATQWQAMWNLPAGQGSAGFELAAADALAAWQAQQFELPDYYLVVTEPLAIELALPWGPRRDFGSA